MINWPTAFVIAVAMICGAVLINKPSDAAFGGDGGDGLTFSPGCTTTYISRCPFIHAHNGQLRQCEVPWGSSPVTEVKCTDWLSVRKY